MNNETALHFQQRFDNLDVMDLKGLRDCIYHSNRTEEDFHAAIQYVRRSKIDTDQLQELFGCDTKTLISYFNGEKPDTKTIDMILDRLMLGATELQTGASVTRRLMTAIFAAECAKNYSRILRVRLERTEEAFSQIEYLAIRETFAYLCGDYLLPLQRRLRDFYPDEDEDEDEESYGFATENWLTVPERWEMVERFESLLATADSNIFTLQI